MRRHSTVGAALGPDRLWLTDPRTNQTCSRELDPGPSADGTWPALSEALADLHAELRLPATPHLAVALLPSLAQVRLLPLPLTDAEAPDVLRRDAARWFLAARGEHAIAALSIRRRARGSGREILAAAAPRPLVDAVHAAGRAAGWRAVRVVPAVVAWWAVAARPGERTCAIVPADDALHVLCDDGEGPLPPRRVRLGPGAAERLKATLSALGTLDARRLAEDTEAAARLAAAHAPGVRALELRARGTEATARRRRHRATGAVLAAALGCAAAAAALLLVDARRELAHVADARGRIRAAVAERLATDGRLSDERAQHEVLRRAESGLPRWSGVLASLGAHLPDDAHLTRFRTSGDTIVLAGEAGSAAGVLAALRATPGVTDVRAEAPIRRASGADDAPVERFSLVIRAVPLSMRGANKAGASGVIAQGERP